MHDRVGVKRVCVGFGSDPKNQICKKFQVPATWITSVLPVTREQSRGGEVNRLRKKPLLCWNKSRTMAPPLKSGPFGPRQLRHPLLHGLSHRSRAGAVVRGPSI